MALSRIKRFRKSYNFRKQLYIECPEFKILHDISNSIKHKKLSSPKVKIQNTEKHEGTFDYTFDSTFDISYLKIIFENGDEQDLLEILEPAINYWIKIIK